MSKNAALPAILMIIGIIPVINTEVPRQKALKHNTWPNNVIYQIKNELIIRVQTGWNYNSKPTSNENIGWKPFHPMLLPNSKPTENGNIGKNINGGLTENGNIGKNGNSEATENGNIGKNSNSGLTGNEIIGKNDKSEPPENGNIGKNSNNELTENGNMYNHNSEPIADKNIPDNVISESAEDGDETKYSLVDLTSDECPVGMKKHIPTEECVPEDLYTDFDDYYYRNIRKNGNSEPTENGKLGKNTNIELTENGNIYNDNSEPIEYKNIPDNVISESAENEKETRYGLFDPISSNCPFNSVKYMSTGECIEPEKPFEDVDY